MNLITLYIVKWLIFSARHFVAFTINHMFVSCLSSFFCFAIKNETSTIVNWKNILLKFNCLVRTDICVNLISLNVLQI